MVERAIPPEETYKRPPLLTVVKYATPLDKTTIELELSVSW